MVSSNARPRARRAPRTLPFHAPVRAWALSEWALVPLRVFIGATFTYAALQKLANPNFFNPASPISIQSQIRAAAHTSPIHLVLTHLASSATLVGWIIAIGELAVGIGTLIGLWTRVAALGGLLISLSLFLTVSFHASPYFTGADIVFFFAWTALLIAGGGSRLSIDGLVASRVAHEHGRTGAQIVPIPFTTVQELCGHFQKGTCDAREGLACDAAHCPVLLGEVLASAVTDEVATTMHRRSVVLASVAGVGAVSVAFVAGAVDAVTGRMINDAPAPSGEDLALSLNDALKSPSNEPAPAGKLLGAASEVPLNEAASFVIPSNGDPGIAIHTDAGGFVAYNAICPHMGCTVGYSSSSKVIVCPCHGSQFQVATGAVIEGPAPHGLTKLSIVEGANGNLYLQ
ncbi:MAG: Rieske 2Fe-2S domain-containing protein [Acidimicrobiales bacterium]